MSTLSPAAPLERVVCPYLGLGDARAQSASRPLDEHRCFVHEEAGEPISHRHQAQFCLSPEWEHCYKLQPGFVPIGQVGTVAPTENREEATPALPGPTRRLLAPSHVASAPTALHATLSAETTVPVVPSAAVPIVRPLPTPLAPALPQRNWQRGFLWLAVALPTVMLVIVGGLVSLLSLSEEQVEARAVLASVTIAPEAVATARRRATMTPGPVAPFVPMQEDPGVLPAVPALPPHSTPDAAALEEGAEKPGPWPSEPATAALDRIRAPSIGLDAPIVPVGSSVREVGGQLIRFYDVAEYAAGWHNNSSLPGYIGNVVLAGHHNIAGKVFEHVVDLKIGDYLFIDDDGRSYPYMVVMREVFPEANASEAQRNENGRWIGQTTDERLTLVTCWPPSGNSHRVVVVAIPMK